MLGTTMAASVHQALQAQRHKQVSRSSASPCPLGRSARFNQRSISWTATASLLQGGSKLPSGAAVPHGRRLPPPAAVPSVPRPLPASAPSKLGFSVLFTDLDGTCVHYNSPIGLARDGKRVEILQARARRPRGMPPLPLPRCSHVPSSVPPCQLCSLPSAPRPCSCRQARPAGTA